MATFGRPHGSISHFKLLMYEEQMLCMIDYKLHRKYPFTHMTHNKKQAFRKNAMNYKYENGLLLVKKNIRKSLSLPDVTTKGNTYVFLFSIDRFRM